MQRSAILSNIIYKSWSYFGSAGVTVIQIDSRIVASVSTRAG